MNTQEVLKKLNDEGFHIKQIEIDKFMCIDNGRFGFINDEDAFIIDEDALFELYEQYIGEIED